MFWKTELEIWKKAAIQLGKLVNPGWINLFGWVSAGIIVVLKAILRWRTLAGH